MPAFDPNRVYRHFPRHLYPIMEYRHWQRSSRISRLQSSILCTVAARYKKPGNISKLWERQVSRGANVGMYIPTYTIAHEIQINIHQMSPHQNTNRFCVWCYPTRLVAMLRLTKRSHKGAISQIGKKVAPRLDGLIKDEWHRPVVNSQKYKFR
jgi:hypothetical protein